MKQKSYNIGDFKDTKNGRYYNQLTLEGKCWQEIL